LIAVELDRVLAAQLRLRFGMFPMSRSSRPTFSSVDFYSFSAPSRPAPSRIESAEAGQVIAIFPYYHHL